MFLPNAASCTDGTACTVGDVCVSGACKSGKTVVCDDGNPCTSDWCDPAAGCQLAANATLCDDNSACTASDQCAGGKCLGINVSCDDGNACTVDSCDPKAGCAHAANTAPCNDGNACTLGDACALSACLPGAATICDDGDPCTDDSCAPKSGCVFAPNNAFCTTSLVGWWHFAEGTGTTAKDSSGHGHTLTLTGGATWQGGFNDYAPKFDGKSGFAEAASASDLQFNKSVTIEARVRIDGATGTYQMAVSKHLDVRLGVTPSLVPFGSVRLANGSWHDFSGGAALATGTWHHLALTYDGATERIFVDGLPVASKQPPGGGALMVSNYALNIGRSTEGAYFWNGAIDEVRLFNTARNDAQILEDATLLQRYDLDDGQGAVAQDLSGNAFDLKVVGAQWVAGVAGKALQFNGKDNYAAIAKTDGLDLNGSTRFSLSTWLNWSSAHCGMINLRPFYVLHLACSGTNSPMLFYIGQGGAWYPVTSPLSYAAGSWHHVVGTYDGSALRLYVDGKLVASTPRTGGIGKGGDGSGNWFVIGKDYDQTVDQRWFDGKIDGVRVYSRVLSAAEVATLAAP